MKQVAEQLLKDRLMILERGATPEELSQIVPALRAGGIHVFEVTFSPADPDCVENGRKAIASAVNAAGADLFVGAGTVLTLEQVHAACDAGACFIVAPNTNPVIVSEAQRLGLAVIPGALTPTEIVSAWNMGVDMVKLFPADAMDMAYIKNLRGPLPHIPLLATGGVNPESIPIFFANGINAVGTGATVVKRDLVEAGRFDEIQRLAELHVQAVRNAKR